MSKFSKGDKARVISVDSHDAKEGVKVGDIVTVNQSDSCCPWVILGDGRIYCLRESQMEHYTETPKEITLNGATYVLKGEPKPEHEWKFGDVAINKLGKVGIVIGVLCDKRLVFYYNEGRTNTKVSPHELIFLRRSDLSKPKNKTFNPGDQIYARKAYSVYGSKATVLEKTDGGYKVKFEDGYISDIPEDRISATII